MTENQPNENQLPEDVATPVPAAPAAPKSSAFAANLKTLPKVSHLAALTLSDADGNAIATIENKPGQAGSLAVYNHLAQIWGAITPEAAAKGLDIYAEHTEDARLHPGKHPNIDRLFELLRTQQTLRVKHVFEMPFPPSSFPGEEG